MEILIQKNGSIRTGINLKKVKGVEYLSVEETEMICREQGLCRITDAKGKVIAKSAFAITEDEQKVIDKQKATFGEDAGMTVKEMRERDQRRISGRASE